MFVIYTLHLTYSKLRCGVYQLVARLSLGSSLDDVSVPTGIGDKNFCPFEYEPFICCFSAALWTFPCISGYKTKCGTGFLRYFVNVGSPFKVFGYKETKVWVIFYTL